MRHSGDMRAIRRLAVLFFVAMALAHMNANAQAVRYDNFASTTSAQCSPGKQCPLNVLPGTIISLCTGTAATLSACLASPATTYTDSTLGTPCPTTAQLTPATGGACISTADNQGGYGFWASSGQYSYYLRVPPTAGGGTYGPYPLNIGASTGCPSNATCDANYATLPLACSAAGAGTLYVTRAWNGLPSHTYSCQMQFLSAGRLQPASGQVITVSGTIAAPPTQIFDTSLGGAGSIILTGPLVENLANWFGVSAGSADNTAATVAAFAANSTVMVFACGVYGYMSPLIFAVSGSSIHGSGENCSELHYTGSGSIARFVTLGPDPPSGIIDLKFGDLTILGNANVTNVLYAQNLDQGTMVQNLRLDQSTGAALVVVTSVEPNFVSIHGSSFDGAAIPQDGIDVLNSNGVNVVSSDFETHPRYGRFISGSTATKIDSGTSEGNGYNTWIDSGSGTTSLVSVDDEVPCIENVHDAGTQTTIKNSLLAGIQHSTCGSTMPVATPPSIHAVAGAMQGTYDTITADQFIIDAGASGITIQNNRFGNNFGTGCVSILISSGCDLVNGGSNGTIQNNFHCCGSLAGILPTYLNPQSFTVDSTVINFMGSLVYEGQLQNLAHECTGVSAGCAGASADIAIQAFYNCDLANSIPCQVFPNQDVNIVMSHTLQAGPNTLVVNGGTLSTGTYTSGITATGAAGTTCILTAFNNAGTGAIATVALTGTNTIAMNTPLTVVSPGSGFTSAPTGATASAGSAACSGTATVATVIPTPQAVKNIYGDDLGSATQAAGHVLRFNNYGNIQWDSQVAQ